MNSESSHLELLGTGARQAKYKAKREKNIVVRQTVQKWWRDRVIMGHQLKDYGRFQNGYDYTKPNSGLSRWASRVALAALWADYSAEPDAVEVPLMTFSRVFGALERNIDRKILVHHMGVVSPKRVYIMFKPHREYT